MLNLLNSFYDTFFFLFVEPFANYQFLRIALIVCVNLAFSCAPLGVILVLRRMSLLGDAISHSAMPGVAVGFAISGLSLPVMSFGGFISGFIVAVSAMIISRKTVLKEDASLVGFYLIAFAIGVIIVSKSGSNVDLMHILIGNILAVDKETLLIMTLVSSITIISLAIIFRALVLECFDPIFMKSIGGPSNTVNFIFITLVVANLVIAIHALGTLMALGTMMLPAITARFWSGKIFGLFIVSVFIGLFSGYFGLFLSYHFNWPSGPAIVVVSGGVYIFSTIFGKYGTLRFGKVAPEHS